MRLESKLRFTASIVLLILGATSLILKGQAPESQNLEFEIIDSGDISGYWEETYFVVRNETEWANVWENHTRFCVSTCGAYPPRPDIDFSEKMVICAFMGRRPTAGYSVSVERIWVEEEEIHVEIVHRDPANGSFVAQVITYPYVFVSLEKMEVDMVFHVGKERVHVEYIAIPEFPVTVLALSAFLVLSLSIGVITKSSKKQNTLTKFS